MGKTLTSSETIITVKNIIFTGSNSVLIALENRNVCNKITFNTTEEQALEFARETIKQYFIDFGIKWDYELQVKITQFSGKDQDEIRRKINSYMEGFLSGQNFESNDESGDSQGYTFFTLTEKNEIKPLFLL